MQWALVAIVVPAAIYLALVLVLLLIGRRADALALARFIPDCIVLFKRLLGDDSVSGWRRAAVVGLIAYLALPVDLIPDFFPVAGQLDDAILVALVLRTILRSGGPELLKRHWPGPPESLGVVTRLAYGRP